MPQARVKGQCLGARENKEHDGPATDPTGHIQGREKCSIVAGGETGQVVPAEGRRLGKGLDQGDGETPFCLYV